MLNRTQVPRLAARVDELDHVARRHDVEPGGGLIEDEHGRIVEHRAGDGHALLLAGRESLAAPVAEGVQVEGVEGPRDRGPRGHRPSSPWRRPEVAQGLPPGEARVEPGAPREEAESAPDLERVLGHVDAVDQCPA